MAVSGDCFQCGKCIGQCPVENIHAGLHSDGPVKKRRFRLRGDELWFTLLRAGILAVLLVWLGA